MSLVIDQLTFFRQGQKVLDAVSLAVIPQKVIAFLGPNGSGKTTLLKVVMGLTPLSIKNDHQQHYLCLDGQCLCQKSITERIAAGIVYMPQQSILFDDLTASENIMLIYEYHPFWKDKSKQDFQDFIDPWIDKTAVREALQTGARFLSGGQKRKVELIRTLAMQPKIMLLDEPFAGVDPKSIEEIQDLLSLVAEAGVGILISDHHVFQLLHAVDYAYVLVGGVIIAHGMPDAIMHNSEIQALYLGKKIGYHRQA